MSTTPTPTPTAHLSSLAAALQSGDPRVQSEAFARMSDEALALCESAPSEQLWLFWLRLSETFQGQAQELVAPPKPKKRRWFR